MLVHHCLVHEIHRHLHGRRRRALAGARLQEIELALLDRELDVLHVLVVTLEAVGDGEQLVVDLRHAALQIFDVLRRADAGDDVFALRVGKELGVEAALAGTRVAREPHAGARRLAEIAEHHRHDGDRGAPVAGDVVDAAVFDGLLAVPGIEDGAHRQLQLLARILRKRRVGARDDDVLVDVDELAQVGGRDLGIGRDTEPLLRRGQMLVERLTPDAEDHVAEHRDESPIAVPRESFVARPGGEPLDRLVVEAEIEDRLHHARHRDARAGTHRDEQGTARVAEAELRVLFQLLERGRHLIPQPFGKRAPRAVVGRPRLGGDREAGRDGNAEIGHLGELGALATEQVAHDGGAFRLAGAERVHVLDRRHRTLYLRRSTREKVFQFYWIPIITVNVSPNLPPAGSLNCRPINERGHGSATRGPFLYRLRPRALVPARGVPRVIWSRTLRAGPAAAGPESARATELAT